MYDHTFHQIVSTPVQYSTKSAIPKYPIAFWNVNEWTMEKTNNAFYSSHFHFMVFFINFY